MCFYNSIDGSYFRCYPVDLPDGHQDVRPACLLGGKVETAGKSTSAHRPPRMRPSHAVCYFSLYHRCLRSSKGNNGQPYCLLENSKWSFTNKSEAKRLWYRIFASMCKRSLSLGQKPFQRRRYFIVEIVHVNCKSNQERNSVPAISKIFEKAASIRPKP